jgi:hypothetical protein
VPGYPDACVEHGPYRTKDPLRWRIPRLVKRSKPLLGGGDSSKDRTDASHCLRTGDGTEECHRIAQLFVHLACRYPVQRRVMLEIGRNFTWSKVTLAVQPGRRTSMGSRTNRSAPSVARQQISARHSASLPKVLRVRRFTAYRRPRRDRSSHCPHAMSLATSEFDDHGLLATSLTALA